LKEAKKSLLGLTIAELQDIVTSLGLPKFTATQIAQWLYNKRVSTIDEMTNISQRGRDAISEQYIVGRSTPIERSKSKDGTIKYLFCVSDDKFIESVYIPDRERATLCISSQIGCQMKCEFCATGKQGFKGNLTSGQIINQILSIDNFENLTNIVYMGMGEPLNNTDEVLKSIEIVTSSYGMGWSPRRVTLSSVGVIPGLKRFLDESHCNLAISLHIPYSDVRAELMPAEKAYPITEVLSLLKQYDWSGQRRLSFEYTMFKGVNDSISDADHLSKLIKGLACRVNIIPYHKIPDTNLVPSDSKTIEEFAKQLENKHITATVRRSRGEDIEAACGMLSKTKGNEKL